MNPFEIGEVVYDLCANWAVGDKPMGSYYWPREIERRKKILEVLRRHSPPPALGKPPEAITDPILIMLWGITTERVKEWLSAAAIASGVKRLTGIAASPGIAEGAARVISSPEEILKVKDGEILVAPTTAPSWNVVFGKIKAAVTDIGGLMSHAAIVAREYGLPAVVGVGYATQVIKDGMKIRVNGDEGVVEILEG
jgi:pyruvate,water dikinase